MGNYLENILGDSSGLDYQQSKKPQRPQKPEKGLTIVKDQTPQDPLPPLTQPQPHRFIPKGEVTQAKLNQAVKDFVANQPHKFTPKPPNPLDDTALTEARPDLRYIKEDALATMKHGALKKLAGGGNISDSEKALLLNNDPSISPEIPYSLPSHGFAGEVTTDIARSALDVLPKTLGGVGQFAEAAFQRDNPAQIPTPGIIKGIENVSENAQSFLRGQLPSDPSYEGTTTKQIAEGIGTGLGMLATGTASKLLGVPGLVTGTLTGGALNAESIAKEADEMGVNSENKNLAVAMATGTGMLSSLPFGNMLDKFGLRQTFNQRLLETATNSGAMGVQQWLNNIDAKFIGQYDPDRPLSKDTLESILTTVPGMLVNEGLSYGANRLFAKIGNAADTALYKQRVNQIENFQERLKASGGNSSIAPILDNNSFSLVHRNDLTPNPDTLHTPDPSLTFDLMPGLKEGQAPYLRIPSWLMNIVSGGDNKGFNQKIGDIDWARLEQAIQSNAPSREASRAAITAIHELKNMAIEEGVNSLSFHNHEADTTNQRVEGGVAQHETLHAAQNLGLQPDPKWAADHSTIKSVMSKPGLVSKMVLNGTDPSQIPSIIANEIPAYLAEGKLDQLGLSSAEGIDYAMDYYQHLLNKYGPESLQTIKEVARLRPEMLDMINLAESMWKAKDNPSINPPSSTDAIKEGLASKSNEPEKDRPIVPDLPGRLWIRRGGTENFIGVSAENVEAGSAPDKVKVSLSDGSKMILDINDVRYGDQESKRKISDPMMLKLIAYSQANDPTVRGSMGQGPMNPNATSAGSTATPPVPPSNVTNTLMGSSAYGGGNVPVVPSPGTFFGPLDPLFQRTVKPGAANRLETQFRSLVANNGLSYNDTIPISTQIYEAVLNGDIKAQDIPSLEASLQAEGVGMLDLGHATMKTWSEAGRVLGDLGNVKMKIWDDLLKNNPTLAAKMVPAVYQFKFYMDQAKYTALGKTWLQRSSGLMKSMLLTQVSTAMARLTTNTGRLMMDAPASMIGQFLENMHQGSGNFMDRLTVSNKGTVDAMGATLQVLSGIKDVKDIVRLNKGTEYQYNMQAFDLLKRYYPDKFHSMIPLALKDQWFGEENTKGMKYLLSNARNAADNVEDESQRRDFQRQLDVLDRRLRVSTNIFGRSFNIAEMTYGTLAKPLQIAEFMFARPMFVGQLRTELSRQGIDLNNVISNTHNNVGLSAKEISNLPKDQQMSFADIPEDAMRNAINKAMDFKYSSQLRTDKDAPFLERQAGKLINWMQDWSVLGASIEPFPRAMYSGLKWAYDYSPLPVFMGAGEGLYAQLGGDRSKSENAFYRVLNKDFKTDQTTGETYQPNTPRSIDYERMGRAFVGTMAWGVSAYLMKNLGGPNWYQISTGKKDKDGNPVYLDVRKYSGYLPQVMHLLDLTDRVVNHGMGDLQIGRELEDIYSGVRVNKDAESGSILDAFLTHWGGEGLSQGKIDSIKQGVGRQFLAPFLTPLLNIRMAHAAFSDDENKVKDLKGEGFMGPVIDRIPWYRQNNLPDFTSPLTKGSVKLSESPVANILGTQISSEGNFAKQEFDRMGINIRDYFPKNPDPLINREMDKKFAYYINNIGKSLSKSDRYRNADDKGKMRIWESKILGEDGIAARTKEDVEDKYPQQEEIRDLKQETPGKYTQEQRGVTKRVEKLRQQEKKAYDRRENNNKGNYLEGVINKPEVDKDKDKGNYLEEIMKKQ